jgi:uncharacterized protein (DUF1499 family)
VNQYIGMAAHGPKRSAAVCLWAAIFAVGLAAGGAYGAGLGFWPFGIGLLMVAGGFLLAVIAVPVGLFAAARNSQGSGLGRRIVIGLLAAATVLAGVGPWVYRGFAYPPIHDVTTDVANPPAFTVVPPRKDILAGVGTVDAWRSIHAKAYSDLRPLTIKVTPDVAIARARAFAQAQGWTIAPTAKDRLEATATVSPFRFRDDVVVTATPVGDGQSTLINIRSVSRVGVSDFGLNAKRVRNLLSAIETPGKN